MRRLKEQRTLKTKKILKKIISAHKYIKKKKKEEEMKLPESSQYYT